MTKHNLPPTKAPIFHPIHSLKKTGMRNLICTLLTAPVFFFGNLEAEDGKIDRKAVVERNSPVWNEPLGVTTLGNGEFAFNCDATGLQTFAGNTTAHWAWHSFPRPENFEAGNQKRYPVDSHGRTFNYLAQGVGAKAARTKQETEARRWYYDNPHMMNLCRIAFRGKDGAQIKPEDVNIISRKLDLWNGRVESVFEYLGERVGVVSTVHPDADAVGVRVDSALLKDGRLGVVLTFGYPLRTQLSLHAKAQPDPNFSSVFNRAQGHKTILEKHGRDEFRVIREMDDGGKYMIRLCGTKGLSVSKSEGSFENIMGEHTVILRSENSESAEFTAIFENLQNTENASDYGLDRVKKIRLTKAAADFGKMKDAAQKHWNAYWNNGGIADFSASTDPRWKELERRVVLSQFLMAANSAGSMPPSEAGLLATDYWCGKFHLEMTAWHGAHFFFWGRGGFLKGWVEWYNEIGLKSARAEAAAEGLKGAKWLKTPDPFGRWESWDHGPNRITQNVHPFYLAELSYRAAPSAETLRQWKDIILETTQMMLDFLYWDAALKRYVLGPPLMSGAEGTRGFDCWNSTSELNYWALALQMAQKWRARLGMPEDEKIAHVLKNISKPPVVDGVYIDAESHPETWDRMPNGRFLRPAWLEVYGCVNGPLTDSEIMARTYDKIAEDLRSGEWKGNLWGCDYPMLAMSAARLGRHKEAVDWLLFDAPLNAYTPAGYNAGWYLPGNGGLLWAVALMCAGWDGSESSMPGFPKDGSWSVKFEGISKVP